MIKINRKQFDVSCEIPAMAEDMEGKLMGGFLGLTGTRRISGKNEECDGTTNDLDCINESCIKSTNWYCHNTKSCGESKNHTTPAPPPSQNYTFWCNQ